jgi:transcriptional regulator with XRE-family HTH domain
MDYKKLGRRIKEQRLKKILTQEKLAESMNLSSVYIIHIENASTKPILETLVNLSNAKNTRTMPIKTM